MNKLIINGLVIETSMSYLRFDKSSARSITEDPITKVLIIKFIDGDLSDSLSTIYELKSSKTLEEVSVVSITNYVYTIQGIKFIKLTLGRVIFSQIVTEQINPILVEYSPLKFNLFTRNGLTNIQYKDILNSSEYFEVVDDSGFTSTYYSLNNEVLDKSNKILISNSIVPFNKKSDFTKYIMDEPLCLYSVLEALKTVLIPKGFSFLIQEDYDELTSTEDFITYSHESSGMDVIKKNPSGFASKYKEVNLPVNWSIRTKSISRAIYFRDHYNNLDIISNLSSLVIKDYNQLDYRVAPFWETPCNSNIGHKSSRQDDTGNFNYQIDFKCIVNYGILFDDTNYVFINKIDKFLLIDNYLSNSTEINSIVLNPNPENPPTIIRYSLNYNELVSIVNQMDTVPKDVQDSWSTWNVTSN